MIKNLFKLILKGFLALLVISYAFIPTEIFEGSVKRFTQDEVCMINILWEESRGEGVSGASLVYDVVMNRVKAKNISICHAMKERAQFSFYTKSFRLKLTQDMYLFYTLVKAEDKVLDDNVLWYHATYIKKPIWTRAMEKVVKFKNHIFYKMKEKK